MGTSKKKHRTMEDQFVDPDDNDETDIVASTSTTTQQKADELDKYLKISIDDQFKTSNPLPFWQHYQEQLPYLAKFARRPFSVPATSSCVERQFSAAGVLI